MSKYSKENERITKIFKWDCDYNSSSHNYASYLQLRNGAAGRRTERARAAYNRDPRNGNRGQRNDIHQ